MLSLLALAVAFYAVLTVLLVYVLWITGWRPRELPALEWDTPDQDDPIP